MASPENTIHTVHYAGGKNLRYAFLQHMVSDDIEVIAAGGGTEPEAIHPLPVARSKVLFVREQKISPLPNECCVAFDLLTYVPITSDHGTYYEVRGKPTDDEAVQHLFHDMSRQKIQLPYRIRAASVLQCGNSEYTAWHDASISLSARGVSQLATDSGLAAYISLMKKFGNQSGQIQGPTNFAAGLHLETLLALGHVEAIDDVGRNQIGFEAAVERAIFLATVGASHRVLGPLTHDPMGHIVTFPHHRDRIMLVGKLTGSE